MIFQRSLCKWNILMELPHSLTTSAVAKAQIFQKQKQNALHEFVKPTGGLRDIWNLATFNARANNLNKLIGLYNLFEEYNWSIAICNGWWIIIIPPCHVMARVRVRVKITYFWNAFRTKNAGAGMTHLSKYYCAHLSISFESLNLLFYCILAPWKNCTTNCIHL